MQRWPAGFHITAHLAAGSLARACVGGRSGGASSFGSLYPIYIPSLLLHGAYIHIIRLACSELAKLVREESQRDTCLLLAKRCIISDNHATILHRPPPATLILMCFICFDFNLVTDGGWLRMGQFMRVAFRWNTMRESIIAICQL